MGSHFDVFLGGKGCNQAIAAARAGAPTAMIGRLGADDFGTRFLDRLDTEGIDATGVSIDPDEGTGVGAPLVEDDGENSIVIIPRANHRITMDDIDAAAATIERAAVLLLQLELPARRRRGRGQGRQGGRHHGRAQPRPRARGRDRALRRARRRAGAERDRGGRAQWDRRATH